MLFSTCLRPFANQMGLRLLLLFVIYFFFRLFLLNYICIFHYLCRHLYLQVEAGDVIVRVNGTDVHHFTTKEGIAQ